MCGLNLDELRPNRGAATDQGIGEGIEAIVRVRSGGGVHNPQMMAHLASFLPGWISQALGITA
jgi:hypothetical protein